MARAHGEGSIYRRKSDGRWVAALKIHGKTRSRYSKTQYEARQNLAQLRREAQSFAEPRLLKFRDWAAYWLRVTSQHVRPTTLTSYEKLLRLYAVPELGNIRLDRLRPRHISGLYAKTNKSPRTVGQLHRVIHSMLKDAVTIGELHASPADLVSPPKVERYEYPSLDAAQIQKLVDASYGHPHELFLYLAIQGLRSGEILALTWHDFRMDNRPPYVNVNGTLHREKGGGWRVGKPKTKSSVRPVGLAGQTVDAVERRRSMQLEERLKAGPAWENHRFVLTNAIGRPLRQDSMLKLFFHPALERAGLPKMRVHDLRHVGASILITRGMSPTDVAHQWGHSSAHTTLSMYSHALPDSASRVAADFDESLGGS